jgi:predicted pyridoxine 5'-phosphate oxidase superfamily flavin-nucleotide-binding protein
MLWLATLHMVWLGSSTRESVPSCLPAPTHRILKEGLLQVLLGETNATRQNSNVPETDAFLAVSYPVTQRWWLATILKAA